MYHFYSLLYLQTVWCFGFLFYPIICSLYSYLSIRADMIPVLFVSYAYKTSEILIQALIRTLIIGGECDVFISSTSLLAIILCL